jgi:predicted bacteriocin transport accessory protein
MKRLIIVLLGLSFLLSACTQKGLTPLKPQAAIQKFDNEETFVLYLGLSYCAACKIFTAIAEEVIEAEKITIFHMDFDKEDETQLANLVNKHLQQVEPFPYSFPILFVVKDGKIIDRFSLVEADSVRRFTDRMISNGVIQR